MPSKKYSSVKGAQAGAVPGWVTSVVILLLVDHRFWVIFLYNFKKIYIGMTSVNCIAFIRRTINI